VRLVDFSSDYMPNSLSFNSEVKSVDGISSDVSPRMGLSWAANRIED